MSSRISTLDLFKYVNTNYEHAKAQARKQLQHFPFLLQNDYGGTLDCTITSITAVKAYKGDERDTKEIYGEVESVSKKYGYKSEIWGSIPLFTRKVLNEVFNTKSKVKYFKGIGFNFDTIKNLIDKGQPIILSMANDGRGYYKNHTVTVIGYVIYQEARMLIVADNWNGSVSYLDYGKLSKISSLNWIEG